MTLNDTIICPKCALPLRAEGKSLVCENRHTYDIAKSGYVNLINTSSKKESGDSKEMAEARTRFLDGGAYEPFRRALCDAAGEGDVIIDAGCGEGYYTNAFAEHFSLACGFDLSKAAVERAAKRARALGVSDRTFFGVGSVYSMPVADGCADTVTNIFAPCAEREYLRVLKDGGRLLLACAGKDHLSGLKRALYSEVRENTERADLPSDMKLCGQSEVRYDISLTDRDMIRSLFLMTPYAYKTSIEATQRLFSMEKLETNVHFVIYEYKKA